LRTVIVRDCDYRALVARPHLHKLLDVAHSSTGCQDESLHQNSEDSSRAEHFCPAENLEDLDISYLRQARQSINVAMF
jgi:hypothetical protein